MDTRIFYFSDRLIDIANFRIPIPIHAFIDTTQECNHRCWYCYDYVGYSLGIKREKSSTPYTPIKDLIYILEELNTLGIRAYDFCGGEPLYYPHSKELLNAAANLGVKYGLVTNGTMITGSILELVANHACWVRFSIDTIDEKLFKKTRRPISEQFGSNYVLKNLSSLVSRRKELKRNDFLIGVNCVVDRRHVSSIYDTAFKLKDIGVDYVIYDFVNAGKSIQSRLYNHDHLELIMNEIHRTMELVDESFQIYEPTHESLLNRPNSRKGFSLCYWSLLTLTFDVDGNLYACPEMKHDERFLVGNRYDESLSELVFSHKRWDIAKQINFCSNCCKFNFNAFVERHLRITPNQLPFI